jgi:hypothetical protein
MKLEINVFERHEPGEGWITATVEDHDGNQLASQTAPVTEGATFDQRAAVVRAAVEEALADLARRQRPMSDRTLTLSMGERMADELEALGLYATSNEVRSGRATLGMGIVHVRDYCLPNTQGAVEKLERHHAEDPPTPGTWGETAAANARARRDELQAFLDRWEAPAWVRF